MHRQLGNEEGVVELSANVDGPERIRRWMRIRGIKGEIIRTAEAATSSSAADSLGVPLEKIVKSVLFIDERREPLLVILGGENKVVQTEFARMIGRKKIRLATRDEVLRFTGYPAGGVPPLALQDGIEIFVDNKIKSKGTVHAGGGTEEYILKIDVTELVNLYKDKLVDVPVRPI